MRRVCVRGMAPGAPGVVYCGRACAGWPESPLASPFVLAREADRPKVLAQYRRWLSDKIVADDSAVVPAVRDLPADAALGCWCPLSKRCHCDVIIEFATLLREGV